MSLLISCENVPSHEVALEPPEFMIGPRLSGGNMHSVPPTNGVLAAPEVLAKIRPFLAPCTFEQVTK